LAEIGINTTAYDKIQQQYTKQVLKKLKSEFRKEDMTRNAREAADSKPLTIVTMDLGTTAKENIHEQMEELEPMTSLYTPSTEAELEKEETL
jgi:hypothetical protein